MERSEFFGWTPERDRKLETMLQAKASTRQIAVLLKVSQGAVARRIKKLNLKLAHVPKGGKNSVIKKSPVVRKKVVVKVIKKRTVVQMVPTEKPAQAPAEVDDSVAAIFAGVGVPLATVRDGLCRWPYDSARPQDGRCCGGDTGGHEHIYCAKHMEIATRGAKKWERNLSMISPLPPRSTRFT